MAATNKTKISSDAKEFGAHFKQGGWRLGLLVARSVEPSQGKRTDQNNLPTSGKVTAVEFAKIAGVSSSSVDYYYKTWQLAAKAGKVIDATKLIPGEDDASIEFDEDDDESRKEWIEFYRKAREPQKPKPKPAPKNTANKQDSKFETDKKPPVDTNKADNKEDSDESENTANKQDSTPITVGNETGQLDSDGNISIELDDIEDEPEITETQDDSADETFEFLSSALTYVGKVKKSKPKDISAEAFIALQELAVEIAALLKEYKAN